MRTMTPTGAAEWAELDLRHCWHPFTQMKVYEPKIIVDAEGALIRDVEGKEYIDGFAGLWTVNVGHGRREIADAVVEQMGHLAFFSLFKFSNLPAIRLSTTLAEVLPGDLSRVFLTLSGSESVETALKMARQYWRNRGQGSKYKVIARDRSYHGTTMGATAAQGLTANRTKFDPPVPGFYHVAAPYCYRCRFALNPETCALECAADLEREVLFQGPDTVAAFIGEIVIGTGGVVPAPKDYWRRVRQICDRYDMLLIADEVITGFGRTGKMFGVEHYGIVPDIMTLAKGITSGYLPMGAVGVRDSIYQAFLGAEGEGKEFASGCTLDGHPVCCAAALANLTILQRERLAERSADMGEYLHSQLKKLHRHWTVGEVRGLGLLAGVELVRDQATRAPFPPSVGFGSKVQARAYELGAFCRLLYGGNTIAIAPPLVISREQIDRLVSILDQAIGEWSAAIENKDAAN